MVKIFFLSLFGVMFAYIAYQDWQSYKTSKEEIVCFQETNGVSRCQRTGTMCGKCSNTVQLKQAIFAALSIFKLKSLNTMSVNNKRNLQTDKLPQTLRC